MADTPFGQETGKPVIGPPVARIDGSAKVTGEARYASDFDGGRNPAYACLVTSTIARGRIAELDDTDARAVAGVLDILTHHNVGDLIEPGKTFDSRRLYRHQHRRRSRRTEIWHDGQIVALVVAETFEAAREAAHRLKITYDGGDTRGRHSTIAGARRSRVAELSKKQAARRSATPRRAFAAAAVTIDAALRDADPAPQPDRAVHHDLLPGPTTG